MIVMRAFIGVYGLKINHIMHNEEVLADAVTAVHVTII